MSKKIVRFYASGREHKIVASGLSLQEAGEWCSSDESSSQTATSPLAREHTEKYGEWFDGMQEE